MQNQEQLRKFVTVIQAYDQFKNDGSIVEVNGPLINAPTFKIAQEEMKVKGINYLKIVGELKEEIIEVQPDPFIIPNTNIPKTNLPKLNLVK